MKDSMEIYHPRFLRQVEDIKSLLEHPSIRADLDTQINTKVLEEVAKVLPATITELEGIGLREYFAGKALTGLIDQLPTNYKDDDLAKIAEVCWAISDSLIANKGI